MPLKTARPCSARTRFRAILETRLRPLPPQPSLYQVDVRDWLWHCRGERASPCRLDQIPDGELDRLARLGFDFIYLLGVWQTGRLGTAVSRRIPDWQRGFHDALSDLAPEDITGSPFAVTAYDVHESFGGADSLEILRARMSQRGLRLILDFVPNHTALDHPWIQEHPDYYVTGTASQFAARPADFEHIEVAGESRFFAHGKDPYFPAWPDTAQLNYANPALQAAMIWQLRRVAKQCDGLRCDMSMLVLPEVFEQTWGRASKPFWPEAISACRQVRADFVFLAEVYWGLEGVLLDQGFDYTYDKALYDRLLGRQASHVRDHLAAPLAYQSKMARFLENHDEPRAAAIFPAHVHCAAAAIAYLGPGMRFFESGQLEGARIRPSVHLRRRADEAPDPALAAFYGRLLELLRSGLTEPDWQMLWPRSAWAGNETFRDFVAFGWSAGQRPALLVAANYSGHSSQCYVPLPFAELAGKTVTLSDALGEDVYERSGDNLLSHGLYLDVPAWKSHAFRLRW